MRRASAASVPLVLLAAAVALVFANGSLGDYDPHVWASGNAGPGIDALLDGHVARFFAVQPLMGLASILLRLPFAGLADAFGGGAIATYRAGALACLLGPIVLGVYLFRRMREGGRPPLEAFLVAAICVANPMTWHALRSGHPEEALAGALVVGGVLTAGERPLLSGALIGLAIGTKQWALVAVPVAVVAAPQRRAMLGFVAIAVAACLLLPGPLANHDAADTARKVVADAHTLNQVNAWWPLAQTRPLEGTDASIHTLPGRLTRGDVAPLVPVVAFLLALAFWRRRDARVDRCTEQALAVLALVLVARCALDPGNQWYYQTGLLLALFAWEGLARFRLPLISLLAAASYWALFGRVVGIGDSALTNATYLGLTAILAAYLAAAAFAPRLLAPVRALAPDGAPGG
jgi:glycosyl transferase family 87